MSANFTCVFVRGLLVVKIETRERVHCKKLQFQCRKLIDKDRKRQERNDEIVRSLEDIETRMSRLTSKTKDLETFRISNYPLQKYQDFQNSRDKWNEKLPTSNNSFGCYDDKTKTRTANFDLDNNPKQTVNQHRINKTSDDLNSLAEYMTNSISSRYYKKDVAKPTPYSNHSIYSTIKDYEKGIYDEQENKKIKKDLIPYSSDFSKSFDTQIAVNDEEFGKIKKNEMNSNLLEQRNDIEQENNNRFLNKEQKYYNIQPDVDVLVNEDDKGSIQDSSENRIVMNTNTECETWNDLPHTQNVKNFDKSVDNVEVVSSNHLDEREVQIAQINSEQNISALNSQISNQNFKLSARHDNLGNNETNDMNDNHGISEELLNSQITDKNSQEKEPFDYHEYSQVNQRFHPDEFTKLNKKSSGEEPGQFQMQSENPSEEPYEDHEQPFEEQYEEHGNPAMYPEMQYDAHGQLVQSNKHYLHYDGIEQSDLDPDSSNHPTSGHEPQYEENDKNAIQSEKTEESALAVESHDEKQVETYQESEELDGNENGPVISSETAVSYPETPNNVLGYQVSGNDMNGRTIRDANEPADNEQIQIENRNVSQDLHSDNQYEPQTHQYEDSGQHAYDENGQPILQYDENGQLLQEYDQNAIYQYEQQYDNSAQNYGEPNEQYQQQYEHYDEGQIYQQTGGMLATTEEDQLYMNQVGQYDEHNPTPQNYQYTEDMNTSGADTGMYVDQGGPYGDQQSSQIYQTSGGIIESGENVDEYMSQVEQYDKNDHMPSQEYQQPDPNDTGVERNVERVLPTDSSEGGETQENI